MAEGRSQPAGERLKAVIAAYGANPERWPEADRAAFKTRVSDDLAVAGQLEEARALDALIDLHDAGSPAPGAVSRVLARARRAQAPVPARTWPDRWRALLADFGSVTVPGGVLAASLALGVALGMSDIAEGLLPGADAVLTVLDPDRALDAPGGLLGIEVQEDIL